MENDVLPVVKDNSYLLNVEDLGLSVRAYNILMRAGVLTVGDIRDLGLEGLRFVKNMGSKSIEEIVAVLKEYDIRL